MARNSKNKAPVALLENDAQLPTEQHDAHLAAHEAAENASHEMGEAGMGDAVEGEALAVGQDEAPADPILAPAADQAPADAPADAPAAPSLAEGLAALLAAASSRALDPMELLRLQQIMAGKEGKAAVAAALPTPAMGSISATDAGDLPADLRRKYLAQHDGPVMIHLHMSDAGAAAEAAGEMARKYGASVSIHAASGAMLALITGKERAPRAANDPSKPQGERAPRGGGGIASLTDLQRKLFEAATRDNDPTGVIRGATYEELNEARGRNNPFTYPPALRRIAEITGYEFITDREGKLVRYFLKAPAADQAPPMALAAE